MTMTTSMMSRTIRRGRLVSGLEVSFDEHERLAFAVLAVEAGAVGDVKDAMRQVIASAPAGTDVALVLFLALSHAGDRAALRGEAAASRRGHQ
jgi:hypothetical protein